MNSLLLALAMNLRLGFYAPSTDAPLHSWFYLSESIIRSERSRLGLEVGWTMEPERFRFRAFGRDGSGLGLRPAYLAGASVYINDDLDASGGVKWQSRKATAYFALNFKFSSLILARRRGVARRRRLTRRKR